jgi:hypothetical protein
MMMSSVTPLGADATRPREPLVYTRGTFYVSITHLPPADNHHLVQF